MEIPPRRATDDYLSRFTGRKLDLVCDVDIGEIVPGHHLVVRGLERAPAGSLLHYELVPGVSLDEWYERGPESFAWMLYARDDAETSYLDNNSGGYGHSDGAAAHGVRDLGGVVPITARTLELRFEAPASRPSADYPRRLVFDLTSGDVSFADDQS